MCALTTSIRRKTMGLGRFIIVENATSILVKPLAEEENNFTEAGQNLLQALEIFAQFQDQHSVEIVVSILSRIYQATQDQSLLEAMAKVLGVTVEDILQALEST